MEKASEELWRREQSKGMQVQFEVFFNFPSHLSHSFLLREEG